VAVFSLEMPREQLASRMVCAEARVDVGRMRRGSLQDRDWNNLTQAAAFLYRLPIWIDDSPAPWLKVTDVKSLTGELLPLDVTIEVTGVGVPDQHYACDLTIKLEDEDTETRDNAVIRVELWMRSEPGILKIEEKDRIKFKLANPGVMVQRSFELKNIGRGALKGHLSTTRSWLSVVPDSISIASSASSVFNVVPDAASLSRDFADKAFINVVTNGGNERIMVELSICSLRTKILKGIVTAGVVLAFFAGVATLIFSSPIYCL